NVVLITVVSVVAITLGGIFYTLNSSYEVHTRINNAYVPAMQKLDVFEANLLRSKDLIKEWAFVQRVDEDKNKVEMRELSNGKLIDSFKEFKTKAFGIHGVASSNLDSLDKHISVYNQQCIKIENLLPNFESYSDPILQMEAESFFLENTGIPLIESKCEKEIADIRAQINLKMNGELNDLNIQFDRLMIIIGAVAFFVLLAGWVIGYFARQLRIQREETQAQKEVLDQLYQDLTDSIQYAQRLQSTILPTLGNVRQLFPNSFIFFKPKALVSGDFYWFKNVGGKKLFAAADCTGHGVPGAFMSLVGHNFLNHVTKVFVDPSQILNNVNRLASEVMKTNSSGVRDGMDIALCSYHEELRLLEFCGANNSLYIIRNGELIEMKACKRSIGSYGEPGEDFKTQKANLEVNDMIYIFSDGYADQFGGAANKKFMRKNFKDLLSEISVLEIEEQEKALQQSLEDWKGEIDQTDDILIIGLRIT
ncbi:MAG: PP2C family protein-serine/threonine phosphatase, partial [Bacteroidota bacterium]